MSRLDPIALRPERLLRLLDEARSASSRLIISDYDGTLVPLVGRPEEAAPDRALLVLLQKLALAPGTTIVLVSGRDRTTLDTWLGRLEVTLVAEHGAFLREPGYSWRSIVPLSESWKQVIDPVLQGLVAEVPGSFLEEKESSLVWHYRLAASSQAHQLARTAGEDLAGLANRLGLTTVQGKAAMEVKTALADKGSVVHRWIDNHGSSFVLMAGDDVTDEAMFKIASPGVWTLKVGAGASHARARITSWRELRTVLTRILEAIG